ncbi:MAG: DEAD/DEAH box helicase, partial [Burkholderiaceae bacterium]
MTDTFEVQGDFSPAESFDIATDTFVEPVSMIADATQAEAVEAAPATPARPNGFLKLGLAPELLQAIEDLGYTQPTAVQEQVIPQAMQGEDAAAAFIDLMVSSQTGSGKTAAFLLPVLHTLLRQQAEAEKAERDAWDRTVAEAAARGEAPPKRPKRKNP